MMVAEEGNKARPNMCERDGNTKTSSDWNAVPALIGSGNSLSEPESGAMALWCPIKRQEENRKQETKTHPDDSLLWKTEVSEDSCCSRDEQTVTVDFSYF